MEGIGWWQTLDLADRPVLADGLVQARVAVVAAVTLTAEEVATLERFVAGGGRLVAFRPCLELAEAFGLRPFDAQTDGTRRFPRNVADRYLQLNAACPTTQHAPVRDLQVHGRADMYEWDGPAESVVAHLAGFLGEPTRHPAIVATAHGDGRAAVFTYDLAASTVQFHQGRREQASDGSRPESDGDAMFKANDLFIGLLDERLRDLPQADLHQDLFVDLLAWVLAPEVPLPRLWYFPRAAPAAALFDGDSDSMDLEDLDAVIDLFDRHGVPFTLFLKRESFELVPPSRAAQLHDAGHGLGPHPEFTPQPRLGELRISLTEQVDRYRARYPQQPVGIRHHSVIWVGWTETAAFLAEHGIRLDTNFIPVRYFGRGYLNGSGLPCRFMDEQGQLIDVYEQVTLSTDDGWRTDKAFFPAQTVEECIAASTRQIEDAADRFHTVYHPYFHPVHVRPHRADTLRWIEAALGECAARSLPAFNDRDWVAFNDARRAVQLTEMDGGVGSGQLRFALEARDAVVALSVVLPTQATTVMVDGGAVAIERHVREGREQAFLTLDFTAGQRHAIEVWLATDYSLSL